MAEELYEQYQRRRENSVSNRASTMIQGEQKVMKIPLNEVMDQRNKIRTMIMDIKANIYKIDK